MANMPDSFLGFVLGNLQELVRYNYQLISGVEGNVEELCQRLNTLNGFVKEYTKQRYHQNEFLKSLTEEIKGVVYKAEDLVETYIYSVSLRNSRQGPLKVASDLLSLRSVAEEINESLRRVEQIYDKTVSVGLQAARVDESSVRPTKKEDEEDRPRSVETDVVGLDDKVNEVIELLEKESDQLRVVSITGMFGLGKTTLAKEVLKDPRIETRFPDRAFVKVSQQYNRKKVFLTILDEFSNKITEEIKGMTNDRLAKEVEKELIKTKKYLIVLDDVWNTEAWNALQGAFPKQRGSVILITTRDVNVASHASRSMAPYELSALTIDQSKELLKNAAGLKGNDLDLPPDQERCVSNIVKKCKGLPLSLLVIAGVLQSCQQGRIDMWEKVSKSVDDYVAEDQEHNSLIRLSYDILPFHLKQCFLYLGVLHEGSEIPVWKLLRLWIAEGFITPKGEMSLEDIAENYLERLVARNLVMVSQRKSNGRIKTCLIHDTLRSFCKKEAKAENLFEETECDEPIAVIPASATCHRRRLYVKPELFVSLVSKHSLEYVRSFLSFAKEETSLPPQNFPSSSKGFKLLRVLDVKSIIFSCFPDTLLCLVLLKYIAISCQSNTLPEKISNLSKLQTLIFETSSPTLEVKTDIWKMSDLRHLHTNSSIVLSSSIGTKHQIKELRTLCTFSSKCCTAEFFKTTPNLTKLGIRGKLDTLFEAIDNSCLFAGISEYIKKVQNLKLVNEDNDSSLNVLNVNVKSFPSELWRLTLKNTRLNLEQMTSLGKLESLKVLKLKDNAFQRGKLETSDGGFQCLRVLYISAEDLVEWESSESHFPLLNCLRISGCRKLNAIPSGVGKIRSLQRIELYDPNPLLLESARKIEELKLKREEEFKLSVSNSSRQPNSEEIPPPENTPPNPVAISARGKKCFSGFLQKVKKCIVGVAD